MAASKVNEVAPGVYQIFLPLPTRPSIVNVYLVDCGGAWALIDTGMRSDESIAALERSLNQAGTGIERIDALIATHHHPDHYGASAEISRRGRARVHIHGLELERVERTLSFERSSPLERPETREFFVRHGFPIERLTNDGLKPGWMGTGLYDPVRKPDVLIADGDVIRVGRREFEVIWTPGHSPGHCVIYIRPERVLIVGDHLLPKITPHVGLLPGGPPNPLRDFIASQGKVKLPEVELVLPAHGAVYRNHRARADELIAHHLSREAAILDVIARGPHTAFGIASEIFGREERPIFHVIAATFETLAHLEYSRNGGRARCFEREGRMFYEAV